MGRVRREPTVVVVTGASSGVGRATAKRFARDGARVALLARGEDSLAAAAREVEAGGGTALALPVDVARADDVESAAARVEAELGPIDVWINNAMTTVFGPVAALTPEEFARVTEVTYLGTVWGTMAALRRMTPRNRGTIVQVGSALAYRSIPLQSAYCGAKHAIHGFTDSLRSELLHDHVDVQLTMVQLPAVNTPQFRECRNRMPYRPLPVPPIFQPELIAEGIHHAALHPRREVYLGWPTVKAVIGQKLAPGLLDAYLATHGWDSQFTDERADPGQPDNLFEPVPGDHGTHGDFDTQARAHDGFAFVSSRLGAAAIRGAFLLGGTIAIAAVARRLR